MEDQKPPAELDPYQLDAEQMLGTLEGSAAAADQTVVEFVAAEYEKWEPTVAYTRSSNLLPMLHQQLRTQLTGPRLKTELGLPLEPSEQLRLARAYGNWAMEIYSTSSKANSAAKA